MSFPVILTGGQFTVNQTPMTEVDMIGPGWGTHDEGFTSLALGPNMVGDPIRVPGEYDRGQRKQPIATRRQFPLFMVSECDQNGDPSDVWTNLAYLRANVFDQPSAADRPDGTRYCELVLPNGQEGWADCQFYQPTISQPTPTGWFLVVEFDVIQGHFLPLVS